MCERVFIASDHPLPLIEFNPEGYFWVGKVEQTEQWEEYNQLRELFTKPHLYYAGSHMGCGCGFYYDAETLEEQFPARTDAFYQEMRQSKKDRYNTEEEYLLSIQQSKEFDENGRKSVKELSEYLKTAVATGPVELYVHWNGEKINEPEQREVASPEFWGGKRFRIEARHFYTVVESAPLPIGLHDLVDIFRHTASHRDEVMNSEQCGCTSCLEIFPPSEITEWTGREEGMKTDAICPKCENATVIGSASGFPIDKIFLERVRVR